MYTKRIRIKLGLTQRQLAAKLGISEHTVRKWDQGQHQPEHETMIAIKRLISKYDYDELAIGDKEFYATHEDDCEYILTLKTGSIKPNRYVLTRSEIFKDKFVQGKKTIFKI